MIIDSEPGNSFWRGQDQVGWEISTRLSRDFQKGLAAHESRMFQRFRADATEMEVGISLPRTRFEWVALLQHYGGPTRLLDWSASPFVALYFAVSQSPKVDGTLWRVNRKWLHEASRKVMGSVDPSAAADRGEPSAVFDFVMANSLSIAVPIVPSQRFPRMIAQAGQFTLIGGPEASFEVAIANLAQSAKQVMPSDGKVLEKIVIPRHLKPECLTRLAAMNITEATIYPGLEGLARSVKSGDFLDWFHLPGSFEF